MPPVGPSAAASSAGGGARRSKSKERSESGEAKKRRAGAAKRRDGASTAADDGGGLDDVDAVVGDEARVGSPQLAPRSPALQPLQPGLISGMGSGLRCNVCVALLAAALAGAAVGVGYGRASAPRVIRRSIVMPMPAHCPRDGGRFVRVTPELRAQRRHRESVLRNAARPHPANSEEGAARWAELFERMGLLSKGVTGIEVGVGRGELAGTLLRNGDQVHHLVDTWRGVGPRIADRTDAQNQYDEALSRTIAKYGDARVRVHRAHTWDVAGSFGDLSVDYVFVSQQKSGAGAIVDAYHWWPKLKRGGVFAGDDYLSSRGSVRGSRGGRVEGSRDVVDGFAKAWNRTVHDLQGAQFAIVK